MNITEITTFFLKGIERNQVPNTTMWQPKDLVLSMDGTMRPGEAEASRRRAGAGAR